MPNRNITFNGNTFLLKDLDMKQIHELTQGESAWHAFRAEHFGASEASAVLGLSHYKTRTDLLTEKKTGLTKKVNLSTQKVFDKGNLAESLARPLVEKTIGMDLYPVTVSLGKLSASCDGLSMCETVAWETKQFNKVHFEQVKNGDLPEIHWPQCQQVLYVTGAKKLYFTISDGTEENTVGVWVYPDADKQQQLIDAWLQFEKDLANHFPHETVEPPKAAAIMALPNLSFAIKGEVTLSNLPEFKEAATAYYESISTVFTTDEDFANGEAAAKFCKEAEDNIELKKESALAQTSSIYELMRTLDFIKGQLRDKRLIIEKLVSSEKENRKLAIVNAAKETIANHVVALAVEIKPITMFVSADFAGAIKGKKTLSSMQSAVNDELARAKIEADKTALDIRIKLVWFNNYTDYKFLFSDLQSIISKPLDDFMLLVESRVESHKAAELAKKAKDKEAEPVKFVLSAAVSNEEQQSFLDRTKDSAIKNAVINARPSDDEIINILSSHCLVHESSVISWLLDMDLNAATERMAAEFKAA